MFQNFRNHRQFYKFHHHNNKVSYLFSFFEVIQKNVLMLSSVFVGHQAGRQGGDH